MCHPSSTSHLEDAVAPARPRSSRPSGHRPSTSSTRTLPDMSSGSSSSRVRGEVVDLVGKRRWLRRPEPRAPQFVGATLVRSVHGYSSAERRDSSDGPRLPTSAGWRMSRNRSLRAAGLGRVWLTDSPPRRTKNSVDPTAISFMRRTSTQRYHLPFVETAPGVRADSVSRLDRAHPSRVGSRPAIVDVSVRERHADAGATPSASLVTSTRSQRRQLAERRVDRNVAAGEESSAERQAVSVVSIRSSSAPRNAGDASLLVERMATVGTRTRRAVERYAWCRPYVAATLTGCAPRS